MLDAGCVSHPDRVALIDGDRSWTWSALDRAVALVASEIKPGAPTQWALENSAEQVIGVLATLRARGIWLAYRDDDSAIANAAIDEALDGLSNYEPGPLAPAVVMATSGTTGEPKLVVHSQHSLLGPGLVSVELEPPLPDERLGTPLDLGNANIFMLGPLSALLRGSTFVVLPSRFAPTLAADIARYCITRLFAVPALAYDLVESSEVHPEQLASLQRMILGGSGADPDLLRRFSEQFGVRPTLSYGMSEAPTGVVRESLDDPIGSGRGFPLPHVELEIRDPQGQPVPVGVEGEICLRPAQAGTWAHTWTGTLGYLGGPSRTAELFRDGVLHTGDHGRLDHDGALTVTGRLSDLIIRGGTNVDPRALEAAARSVEHVTDAAAIGIDDERLGQIVAVACVAATTESAVLSSMNSEGLAKVSGVPVDMVAVVDQIPRNEMGKVDQSALAAIFKADEHPN